MHKNYPNFIGKESKQIKVICFFVIYKMAKKEVGIIHYLAEEMITD